MLNFTTSHLPLSEEAPLTFLSHGQVPQEPQAISGTPVPAPQACLTRTDHRQVGNRSRGSQDFHGAAVGLPLWTGSRPGTQEAWVPPPVLRPKDPAFSGPRFPQLQGGG